LGTAPSVFECTGISAGFVTADFASGLVLAFDTTSDYASIALVNAAGVIEEVRLKSFAGLGELLFPEIQTLLDRHGARLDDVSVIATGCGPGSFTGIRVGLTAAKGLAEAVGKPVAGVSRLMAMASFGTKAVRAVISDARRGEVYAAVYDLAPDGNLILRGSEAVAKLEDLVAFVPIDFELLLDEGLNLPSEFAIGRDKQMAEIVRTPRYLAGAVGEIGFRRWLLGMAEDPAEIDASYVRRSDGAMVWTDFGGL
jgi:tRNA threonylcarbamoyladenosine biosynthesis protein TsaB